MIHKVVEKPCRASDLFTARLGVLECGNCGARDDEGRSISELRASVWFIERLRKIAKSVHHLDEVECNQGLTKGQETRLKNLLERAKVDAQEIGFEVFHQSDPRGLSLYVCEKGKADHEHYTDGVGL